MQCTIKSSPNFPFFLFLWAVLVSANCYSTPEIYGVVYKNKCETFYPTLGPEDFLYLPSYKAFLISSHDRRDWDSRGGLFYLPLETTKPKEVSEKPLLKLDTSDPRLEYFRPHGITTYSLSGKDYLLAISHQNPGKEEHVIEKFEIVAEPKKHPAIKVVWLETLRSPLLTSPNDLVALHDGSFFVSNDHGSGGSFRNLFDDAFRIQRADLVYFDGKNFHNMNQPVSFGNGVTYRKDAFGNEFLVRSVHFEETLHVYSIQRDASRFPKLSLQTKIKVSGGPDNIDLTNDDTIVFTTHISTYDFLQHAKSPVNASPSLVYRYSFKDGLLTPLYFDGGDRISAASTGIEIENNLYIGQVFGNFILKCTL